MSEIDRVETIEDIRNILEKRGIQPSFQRIKIFEYLIKHRGHPTVETIYRDLVKEIPTLSKTTVYNTLNLFVEKGLAHTITIEGTEIRYEVATEPHAHFKCLKCGKIYDVFPNFNLYKLDEIEGHKVTELHLYIKGTCKECN